MRSFRLLVFAHVAFMHLPAVQGIHAYLNLSASFFHTTVHEHFSLFRTILNFLACILQAGSIARDAACFPFFFFRERAFARHVFRCARQRRQANKSWRRRFHPPPTLQWVFKTPSPSSASSSSPDHMFLARHLLTYGAYHYCITALVVRVTIAAFATGVFFARKG